MQLPKELEFPVDRRRWSWQCLLLVAICQRCKVLVVGGRWREGLQSICGLSMLSAQESKKVHKRSREGHLLLKGNAFTCCTSASGALMCSAKSLVSLDCHVLSPKSCHRMVLLGISWQFTQK